MYISLSVEQSLELFYFSLSICDHRFTLSVWNSLATWTSKPW